MTSLTAQDVPRVLQCLSQALSTDAGLQQQAEQTLHSLGDLPGFCSVLAEVVGTPEADPSARWLAAVHLKNQVTKQWRRRPLRQGACDGLSQEEKVYLKQKLLGLIEQEDNQVAVQVAIAVSRVARVDFPKEWPALFSDLLAKTASGHTLVIRRVYFVLHHVLKELSSKRLSGDQQVFGEVAQTIFDHVWNCWSEDTRFILDNFSAAVQTQSQQAQHVLVRFERWLLLLKIVRRLIIFGYPSDMSTMQPVAVVNTCAPAMLQALQLLLQSEEQAAQSKTQLLAILQKGLLKLIKTQCQILEIHPWSYYTSKALFPAADCCCSQLTRRAAGQDDLSDRMLTQCCIFLVTVLQCSSYRGKPSLMVNADKGSTAQEAVAEVQEELKTFWDAKRVAILADALLQKHLPLLARELEEWAAAPEDWYHQQESGQWKDNLRGAAEQLFLVLLEAHRTVLAPGLMTTLQTTTQQCPAGTQVPIPAPQTLLLKAAVYSAIAVGSYQLHDYLDYTNWLRSSLLKDLHDPQPSTRLIRKAACSVIAAWVPRLTPEDRPVVYQTLLMVLSDADFAVQLSAAACLRALVDDINFEEGQLSGILGPVLNALTSMLQQAMLLDSQIQVFSTINILVERMGASVGPFTSGILGLAPALWRESEGQTLLRIQILECLQKVVTMLGLSSPDSYAVVGPLIEYSLDMSQAESLSLLEDGLALWLVALRNAPPTTTTLSHLFPRLLPIMAASTEYISAGMSITNSCALLGGRDFLSQYGEGIDTIYDHFLGAVNDKGMVLVLSSMCTMLLVGGADGAALLRSSLLKLLQLLLQGQESTIVMSQALDVVARLIVSCGLPPFQQLLVAAAEAAQQTQPGTTPDSILSALITTWTDNFDSIGTKFSRKLSALAMCALLGVQSAAILHHLQDLLVCITCVWSEQEGDRSQQAIADSDGQTGGLPPSHLSSLDAGDLLVHPSALESEDAEGEFQRRQQVQANDVVLRLRVASTLASQLQVSSSVHGAAFNTAVASMDPMISQQVNAAVQQAGS